MGWAVETMFRLGMIATRPAVIAATAALLCIANLSAWFPGEPSADSDSQYAQAVARHFDDWHPPIMAWLWSVFRLLADGNGPMFCFQVACYWLGFGLVAVALGRAGRPVAAWGMLGVAVFPPFLTMNIYILKDVGLAATFLAGFAGLFWYRIEDRKVPAAVVGLVMVPLFYGTLVRTNAVFGIVPLLVYMTRPRWLGRPWRVLACSVPVALAMVPATGLFNHGVLDATRVEIIRSLQIFDIAGIAFHSGDLSVFGPGAAFTRQEVDDCYTRVRWDTLSPWGQCRFFWTRLAISRDVQDVENLAAMAAMEARPNPDLPGLWIASIIRHPLSYARHRFAHFDAEIAPVDPSLGDTAVVAILGQGDGLATPVPPLPQRPSYLVIYDVVEAPAFWLAIGACLLVPLAFARSPRHSVRREAALALLLSGLPYAGAYLIIGVATDARYQYWTMMATAAAAVISASEWRRHFVIPRRPPVTPNRVDRVSISGPN